MDLEDTIKTIMRKPNNPYAYEIRFAGDDDLYVGSTKGGWGRLVHHVKNWIDFKLDFTLHFFDTLEGARAKEAELIDAYQAKKAPMLNKRAGNIEKDALSDELLEEWSREQWRGEAQDLLVPSLWLYKTGRMSLGYYAWHSRKKMPIRKSFGVWPAVSLEEARAMARELDKEFKKPR